MFFLRLGMGCCDLENSFLSGLLLMLMVGMMGMMNIIMDKERDLRRYNGM